MSRNPGWRSTLPENTRRVSMRRDSRNRTSSSRDTPPRTVIGQPNQAGSAAGGLHVGDLQVVAEIGVDVLVIVAGGQVAELPLEALPARVRLPGGAPAVASPVPHRLSRAVEPAAVDDHAAAFSYRHVVGREERERRHVAERPAE